VPHDESSLPVSMALSTDVLRSARNCTNDSTDPSLENEDRDTRKGSHSIRINDQWRVVFVWKGSDAYEVEVVDYHR